MQDEAPEESVRERAPRFIGIAGGSAGGKTTLSQELLEHAGPSRVTLLELDRFYLSKQEQIVGGETNFDRPEAIDLAMAENAVAELKRTGSASVPIYDFAAHDRAGYESIDSSPLVIVDGILALWHEPLREMFDLSIFVDTPSEERLARRLKRDCGERGRDEDSVRRQWFDSVLPMHDLFVEPTKVHADHVVDGRSDLNALARDLLRSLQI